MADTARNVTPLEAATELTKTWMEKHSAKPYPQVCEAFANFYHAAYRMAHGENANIEGQSVTANHHATPFSCSAWRWAWRAAASRPLRISNASLISARRSGAGASNNSTTLQHRA